MIRRPLKGYVPRPQERASSYESVALGATYRRRDKTIAWMLWLDRLGSDMAVLESRCSTKVFPRDEFFTMYDKYVPDGQAHWEKVNGRSITRKDWERKIYGRVYNMYYAREGGKRDRISAEHPSNWPEYKQLVNEACDLMGLERQFNDELV